MHVDVDLAGGRSRNSATTGWRSRARKSCIGAAHRAASSLSRTGRPLTNRYWCCAVARLSVGRPAWPEPHALALGVDRQRVVANSRPITAARRAAASGRPPSAGSRSALRPSSFEREGDGRDGHRQALDGVDAGRSSARSPLRNLSRAGVA
jgi:hypothetical protein